MTPMVMAIINGEFDIANYLLQQGADPNMATIDGLAARFGADVVRRARDLNPSTTLGTMTPNLDFIQAEADAERE